MIVIAVLLMAVTAGVGAQDAISSATRLEMAPIWVAREFLMSNFNGDAPHAVRVFHDNAVVTFDIPEELAAGGPHSGIQLSGAAREQWITDHLIGTNVDIFVSRNCEADEIVVIDADWGHGEERLPIRMEFTTLDGYIAALRFTDQSGQTPCD